MPTGAIAADFFEHCSTALAKPSFKALATYLTGTGGRIDAARPESEPYECFRLNDHEFVLLSKDGSGLYDCKLKGDGKCQPYEEQPSSPGYSPEVSKEFTARDGKHFALLVETNLNHGVTNQGYQIVYLVPLGKGNSNVPFVVQPLIGVSVNNDSADVRESLCGDKGNPFYGTPEAIDGIRDVTVGSYRTGRAKIDFKMVEQDCDTGKRVNFQRTYVFDGVKFTATSSDHPRRDLARLISPRGLAVDTRGYLFVASEENDVILRVSSAGESSVLAGGERGFADGDGESAKFASPLFLTMAADGALLVSDGLNGAIRRVTQEGRVSTLRGGKMPFGEGAESRAPRHTVPASFEGIVADHSGTIYVASDDHAVWQLSNAGIATRMAGGQNGYADGPGERAKFSNLDSIALGRAGELYVADLANRAIRKIIPDRTVSTLIASDKSLSDFQMRDDDFSGAQGLAVAPDGSVYASSNNTVFKLSPAGVASVYAGGEAGFADGDLMTARFDHPSSLAFDTRGNLFVVDEGNEAIREIRRDGHVVTVITRASSVNQADRDATKRE